MIEGEGDRLRHAVLVQIRFEHHRLGQIFPVVLFVKSVLQKGACGFGPLRDRGGGRRA